MTPRSHLVVKATGERERFDASKIYDSLRACGADKALAHRVVEQARREVETHASTHEIRRTVGRVLRDESPPIAARYLLRDAMFDLGPSGYPFERYIADILEDDGYRTDVGSILEGRCVSHEVDVVASRRGHRLLCECKFRNRPGVRCDVKIALYVQARATDLRENAHGFAFDEFRLVTNAKFTSEATRYGDCVGLGLLGWSYPVGNGLQQLIERKHHEPVTVLATLTPEEKHTLVQAGRARCRDIADPAVLVDEWGFEPERSETVAKEIAALWAAHPE